MGVTTHHQQPYAAQAWMLVASACLIAAVWLLYQQVQAQRQTFQSSHWQQYAPTLSTPQNRYIAVEMGNNKPSESLLQLRASFADMRRAWEGKSAALAKINDKGHTKPVKKKHQQKITTGELMVKIAKVLVLDEVNSFIEKAQLVEEVGQHISNQ